MITWVGVRDSKDKSCVLICLAVSVWQASIGDEEEEEEEEKEEEEDDDNEGKSWWREGGSGKKEVEKGGRLEGGKKAGVWRR